MIHKMKWRFLFKLRCSIHFQMRGGSHFISKPFSKGYANLREILCVL